MAIEDAELRELIRRRTYGARRAPWSGFPTRARPGPLPATGGLGRVGAPSSIGGVVSAPGPAYVAPGAGPVAMPRALPATAGPAGIGTGRPLPINPNPTTLPSSGIPRPMPGPVNPGYAGAVPAGSQVAPFAATGEGASVAATAGRSAGVGRGLAGAGRVALGRGGLLGWPGVGLAASGVMAGMANEGNHPGTHIPGVGGLFNTSGDSTWDQFREGWAINGPVGGVANLAIGGLQNLGLFGGGDDGPEQEERTPTDILFSGIDTAREGGLLTPESADHYKALYDTLVEMGGGADVEGVTEAAATQIQDLVSTEMMSTITQPQQQQMTPEDAMAMQAYAANVMAPYMEGIQANTGARRNMMESLIPTLPAEYQGVVQAGQAQQALAENAMINAYGAQAAMAPMAYYQQAAMDQTQGIASQISQQAIQAQLQGLFGTGQSSSSGDLAALLAEQPTG